MSRFLATLALAYILATSSVEAITFVNATYPECGQPAQQLYISRERLGFFQCAQMMNEDGTFPDPMCQTTNLPNYAPGVGCSLEDVDIPTILNNDVGNYVKGELFMDNTCNQTVFTEYYFQKDSCQPLGEGIWFKTSCERFEVCRDSECAICNPNEVTVIDADGDRCFSLSEAFYRVQPGASGSEYGIKFSCPPMSNTPPPTNTTEEPVPTSEPTPDPETTVQLQTKPNGNGADRVSSVGFSVMFAVALVSYAFF